MAKRDPSHPKLWVFPWRRLAHILAILTLFLLILTLVSRGESFLVFVVLLGLLVTGLAFFLADVTEGYPWWFWPP